MKYLELSLFLLWSLWSNGQEHLLLVHVIVSVRNGPRTRYCLLGDLLLMQSTLMRRAIRCDGCC